jgi:hypothetical protein
MKKTFLFLQLIIILFFCSSASAQIRTPMPAPYWVIESNVKTPRHAVVYFYSTSHQVMYKETIDGKKLNINRPRIRRLLNRSLKEVTLAWKTDKQMKADGLLLAKRFF